ncbi:MAG: hypothetical protein IJI97_08815 [Clostridia bacterium]|jgi:hypothetical protein|nr:hypothetical protein [Clostridia bacterium]
MSNRLHEELDIRCVKAPASIATATATKSDYVDGSGVDEIAFLWSMATLASGKTMTIKIYAADDDTGTNATVVATGTKTAGDDAIAKATGCASIKVAGDQKRFYCAEITHDAGSGVVCSCVAIARPFYSPAAEPALVVSA